MASLRIGAISMVSAIAADDLALLLFHPLAAALAEMNPLDDATAAVDRVVVHARSLAPSPRRR